jgi:hypothetical protein
MDRAALDRLRGRPSGESTGRHAAAHAACARRCLQIHCRSLASRAVKGQPFIQHPSCALNFLATWGRWGRVARTEADHFGNCPVCDGGAGTALYRFDGILENLGFLRYDVTNLAYAIPDLRTGAVIGVGGGRDVLSQRLFGLSDVTGVEINPIIIDVLERHFSGYTAIATLGS